MVAMQSRYSIFAKGFPYLTANVRLPASLSVSVSRMLLTTKMAVEMAPHGNAASQTMLGRESICT